ncbi:MAG: KEOPS complex subunit Pcc1 [Candidatus Bathycorpusculaceae bacterium]
MEVNPLRAKAVVRLKFPSEEHVNIVCRALMPEVEKPTTTRSRATLKKENTFLVLEVQAKDTVALRATLNAYLRWINSTSNVLETLKNIS